MRVSTSQRPPANALALRQCNALLRPILRSHRPLAVVFSAAADAQPAVEVTAQELFQAAMTNMPTASQEQLVGFGGRWERWQPPHAADAVVNESDTAAASAVHRLGATANSLVSQTGWQLISSGQSVYCFQAGAPPGQNSHSALTVHVMEAPDSVLTTVQQALMGAGSCSGSSTDCSAAADIHRSTNTFSAGDIFFDPHLPDEAAAAAAGPAAGLRLWAANHHGFAMAPVALPSALMAAGSSRSHADVGQQMPFIANLYVKHPSLEPGTGCRWGWNLQFSPEGSGSLSHIHHTSLQLLALTDTDLAPDRHQPPAPTWVDDRPAALGIDAFMAEQQQQQLQGSATEFAYDHQRQLQRRDITICTWSSSSSSSSSGSSSSGSSSGDDAAGSVEVWYSSGGYTRSPWEIRRQLEAGRPVVLEAGAVFRDGGEQPCVTRWLLQYRPTDGVLETARIEVYAAAVSS